MIKGFYHLKSDGINAADVLLLSVYPAEHEVLYPPLMTPRVNSFIMYVQCTVLRAIRCGRFYRVAHPDDVGFHHIICVVRRGAGGHVSFIDIAAVAIRLIAAGPEDDSALVPHRRVPSRGRSRSVAVGRTSSRRRLAPHRLLSTRSCRDGP